VIWTALLAFFQSGIDHVTAALPTLPTGADTSTMTGPVGSLFQWAGWANWYAPVDQGVILVGVVLAAYAAFYVVDAVNWALTKLHVVGGSS
jgi:formate/nitrite transporter FocA (FNT family)